MASTPATEKERGSSRASVRSQDTLTDEPFIMRRIRAFSKDLDCQGLLCDECKEAGKPSVPTETFCGRCNRNLCGGCAKAHKKAILSIINTAQTFDKATSTTNKTPPSKDTSSPTKSDKSQPSNSSASPPIRRTPEERNSIPRNSNPSPSSRRTPDVRNSTPRNSGESPSMRRTPDVRNSIAISPTQRIPDVRDSTPRNSDGSPSTRRSPDVRNSSPSMRRTPDGGRSTPHASDVKPSISRESSAVKLHLQDDRPYSSQPHGANNSTPTHATVKGQPNKELSNISKASLAELNKAAPNDENKVKHPDTDAPASSLSNEDDSHRDSPTPLEAGPLTETSRKLSTERATAISPWMNGSSNQLPRDTNEDDETKLLNVKDIDEFDGNDKENSMTGGDESTINMDVKNEHVSSNRTATPDRLLDGIGDKTDVGLSPEHDGKDLNADGNVDVNDEDNGVLHEIHSDKEKLPKEEENQDVERPISSSRMSLKTGVIISRMIEPRETSATPENNDTDAISNRDPHGMPNETVPDDSYSKTETKGDSEFDESKEFNNTTVDKNETGITNEPGLKRENTDLNTEELNTNEASAVATNEADSQLDAKISGRESSLSNRSKVNNAELQTKHEADPRCDNNRPSSEGKTPNREPTQKYYFFSNGQDRSDGAEEDMENKADDVSESKSRASCTGDVANINAASDKNVNGDADTIALVNGNGNAGPISEKTFEIDDETSQLEIGDFEFQGEVSIKAQMDEYSCDVSDMAFISDFELVLADKNNFCLKIIAVETGIVTQYIHLDESPRGITALPSRRLAVAIPDMQQVMVISVLDKTYKVDRKITVDGYCFDVTYADDKLVVPYVSPGTVKIHDLAGNVITTCSFDYKTPQYVSVSPDGNSFLVSDGMGRLVTVNDWNGDVLNVYKFSEAYVPLGVAAIAPNAFIVCFSTRSQLKWVTDDDMEDSIVTKTLDVVRKPKTIVYSPVSRLLYVGSCKRELSGPDCNALKAFRI